MLFYIYRADKPGTEALRMDTRPAHLEWAKTLGKTLVFAGPTLTDDGEKMTGSVWIIEADSRDHADRITATDPFEKVGLFETKIIRRFMQVVPGL